MHKWHDQDPTLTYSFCLAQTMFLFNVLQCHCGIAMELNLYSRRENYTIYKYSSNQVVS